jgi:hypothetical protein
MIFAVSSFLPSPSPTCYWLVCFIFFLSAARALLFSTSLSDLFRVFFARRGRRRVTTRASQRVGPCLCVFLYLPFLSRRVTSCALLGREKGPSITGSLPLLRFRVLRCRRLCCCFAVVVCPLPNPPPPSNPLPFFPLTHPQIFPCQDLSPNRPRSVVFICAPPLFL